jgi:riboflavin kinase/FMN adenylyltransferase
MSTPSQKSVVAIGKFDGVHRGHQALLHQARVRADADGLRCVVLTFDPSPREVLGHGKSPQLTTIERRVSLLLANGATQVEVEPFTMELASWSPSKFVTDLLIARLGATAVVVGENFRFGHQRAGDFATLRRLGEELGFDAIAAQVVGDEEGPFSSTRVRDAVAAGDVERAAKVLGRPHAIVGIVEHGDARGRTIGFPTANLGGVEEMLPAYGVYAVRVDIAGTAHDGVMNIGVRPTVGGSALRLEAHLFDFAGDLYGQQLRVDLVARLRGEQKFSGIDELRAQIAKDAIAARKALKAP